MNTSIPTSFKTLLLLLALIFVNRSVEAQIQQPLVSPHATVSEEVGLTDITIKYARPAVNGRELWGNVVPNGFAKAFPNFGNKKDYPWRAGANQNTTISFEHDVLIEGERLPAGTYGLHMIPSEGDWTIAFNNDAAKWGSFFYEESDDALRIMVTPEMATHQERLSYEFMDQNNQGGLTIALLWGDKKIPFRVEVDDYHNTVLAEMSAQLFGLGAFSWQNYAALANYALANNLSLEKGLYWANWAVAANNSFATKSLQGRFLLREGNVEESDAYMEPLIAASTENELNFYGYQLMGMGLMDKALEVFHLNIDRFPASWNPHDSLADCYGRMGDVANAKKYYGMALAKLPEGDQANKDRINQAIKALDG